MTKNGRKYVSLLSVICVFFCLLGFFGIALFTISMVYHFIPQFQGDYANGRTFDYFTFSDSTESVIFVILIFSLFLVTLILLFRLIYTLNHPVTVMVSLEYVDQDGNVMTINAPLEETREQVKKNKETGMRFQRLSELDKKYPEHVKVETTNGLTLASLCNRLRAFCATIDGNPLYYSIDDIRRFIADMGVSHVLLLQGMSGTGKTSLPVAFGRFTQIATSVVPVQPMWKERSDLLGYYNEFTGKFNESQILEALYESNKSDAMKLIVLDEMNIARVEYYFAEFLSLLELPTKEGRVLEVTTSVSKKDPVELHNGKLQLPDNVWFIGTANNDDSTFAISDKVYDRAMVMNLDYRCEPFIIEGENAPIHISGTDFINMIERAKIEYSLTKRGKTHIRDFDLYMKENFSVTYGNRIRRQIESYVPIYIACGGTEEEAIDDMMAKKVLRKLESQNPVYVKAHSEELIAKMNEIFGEGKMKESEAFVRKLANNA